jgi:flagellar hook protein FlgE
MKSQAHALNTIGSNISNVNTPGYKRTDTRFSTVLSSNLRTGAGSSATRSYANQERALGGVLPKDFQTLDQQGILSGTDRTLDLAIVGDGFFQVSPSLTTNKDIFFTRDGGFQVSVAGSKVSTLSDDGNTIQVEQGYLADKNGYFLLGVSPAADGTFSSTGALAPLRVDQYAFVNTFSATTTAGLNFNLPSYKQFSESNESTTFSIIDSNGLRRSLTTTFVKTPKTNEWQLQFSAENLTTATQSPGTAFSLTTGTGSGKLMQLDPSSRSISIKNELIPTAFSPGAFLGLKVGDSITLSGTTAANGTYTIGAISSDSATITVDASTPLPGGPETVRPVQQVDNITVGGTVEVGDKFTVTLNGVAFNFTATTTTANDVAAGLVAAINGGTEPVTAGAASGGVFSLTADIAGTAFTSAVTTTETDGSAVVNNITVGGTVEVGDKFTVTLNGVAFNFTATTATANDVAAGLVAAINGGTEPVTAGSASGGVFSLTADIAGTAFTSAVTTTETDGNPANAQTIATANVQTIATATATANLLGGSQVTATSTRVVGSPLVFNGYGTLTSPTSVTSSMTWSDGATNTIAFDLSSITQLNGVFTLVNFSENGLASANITDVSFDGQGHVVGNFSDGSARIIYKVPLAVFSNVNGLEAKSGNVYGESPLSGTRRSLFADTSGIAVLSPNTLELSNIDLTIQFTQMIRVQQAYNSSATVFKTVDELLMTARDLKR